MKDGSEKTASKGVNATYAEIKKGVISGENITFHRDPPAFSLRYGQRAIIREVKFSEMAHLEGK